ncbi:hypothetical protein ZIOFF_048224 [Zingiber officinale]|uniref:Uncharacterized protein n=1 Tax=Zingiber officinale TaxID=94328 RepID=A0A8J5KS16_ZINOF|nr:hypothetical protein ZIOFF_048224 [Zingiber officinale]
MGYFREATGIPGPSGFGSASTAEQVTDGIDASRLSVIITGTLLSPPLPLLLFVTPSGSSGIGAEAARVMALRGAHVIIGARNIEAATGVKQSILQSAPSARIEIIQIELSSLKSVRTFAEKFLAMDLPLNILMCHVLSISASEDGIEMQFATNHVGHFLLTKLLIGKMKSTAERTGIEGRIVNLSSEAHMTTFTGGIRYSDKLAYGPSKLANILHANELARALKGGRCKYHSKFTSSWSDQDKLGKTLYCFRCCFASCNLRVVEDHTSGLRIKILPLVIAWSSNFMLCRAASRCKGSEWREERRSGDVATGGMMGRVGGLPPAVAAAASTRFWRRQGRRGTVPYLGAGGAKRSSLGCRRHRRRQRWLLLPLLDHGGGIPPVAVEQDTEEKRERVAY